MPLETIAMTAISENKTAGISRTGPAALFFISIGAIVLILAILALGFDGEIPASRGGPNGLPLPLIIHLTTVIPALPLGAYVLLRRKGDRLHKMLGRTWSMLMMTTAIASFWLGDGFSFIHILSIVTLVSILLAIWRIRHGDVKGHRRTMEAVYIGTVIAGTATFVPGRLLGALLIG